MAKYFKGVIKDGDFIFENRNKFKNSIANMEDGSYILCLIKCIKGTQRDFQKLYFAILGEWTDDTGYTKEELHDLIKGELFPELFGPIESTTDLIPEQWTILVREVENFLILKFENR